MVGLLLLAAAYVVLRPTPEIVGPLPGQPAAGAPRSRIEKPSPAVPRPDAPRPEEPPADEPGTQNPAPEDRGASEEPAAERPATAGGKLQYQRTQIDGVTVRDRDGQVIFRGTVDVGSTLGASRPVGSCAFRTTGPPSRIANDACRLGPAGTITSTSTRRRNFPGQGRSGSSSAPREMSITRRTTIEPSSSYEWPTPERAAHWRMAHERRLACIVSWFPSSSSTLLPRLPLPVAMPIERRWR